DYTLSLGVPESKELEGLLENQEVKQFISFLEEKHRLDKEKELLEYDMDSIRSALKDDDGPIKQTVSAEMQDVSESVLPNEIDLDDLTNSLESSIDDPSMDSEEIHQPKEDGFLKETDADEVQNYELKYYKGSIQVLKEVLGYFLTFKELPWWSPYEGFSEWQLWYNKLLRSNHIELKEYLHELFGDDVIQQTVSNYLEERETTDSDKDYVSKELEKFEKEFHAVIGPWSNEEESKEQSFHQSLIELFGNDQNNLPVIQNTWLAYQFERMVMAEKYDSKEFEIYLKQLIEEKSGDETSDLIAELLTLKQQRQRKGNLVKAVKVELLDWLKTIYPNEDFSKLFEIWLIDVGIAEKVTHEMIEQTLLNIASYVAIKKHSTQLNAILSFIRKSEEINFKYASNLLDLSASFKGMDWLKDETDERLFVELVVFSDGQVDSKADVKTSTEDILLAYKHIGNIEKSLPSLYVLSMLVLEKKSQSNSSLKDAVNYYLDLIGSATGKYQQIEKFLKLLLDSEWSNEPEVETVYNKVFAELIKKEERVENFTEVSHIINQSLRALSADKELLEQIQKEDAVNFETNNTKPMEEELRADWIKLEDGDRVFVANAGMVMLWPFLPALFNNLGYIEDKIFKDRDAQERAVHLLQYIIDGEESPPEFILFLNKVICGIPVEEPIKRFVKLTKKEKEESDSFLTTVIGRWEQMKNTSVPVFRETFLQRDGALQFKKENWYLKVEWKAMDILLTKLPWGISMIKHHWNNYIIFVEWNNKS
ncbi:MAG: hypothetical protein ACI9XB_005089, partial [Gammaproteobacteria bacterium]